MHPDPQPPHQPLPLPEPRAFTWAPRREASSPSPLASLAPARGVALAVRALLLVPLLAAALVVGLEVGAARARAASAEEAYKTTTTLDDYSAYRTSLTGDDSLDLSAGPLDTSLTTGSVLPTYGNPTLNVEVRQSIPGATCQAHVVRWRKTASGAWVGAIASVTTMTGGAATSGDGARRTSPPAVADSGGWPFWEVRVTDISAGTVTLEPHSYGVRSTRR